MPLRTLGIVAVLVLAVVGYFVIEWLIVTEEERIEAFVQEATAAADRQDVQTLANLFVDRHAGGARREAFVESIRQQFLNWGVERVRLNSLNDPMIADNGQSATAVGHFGVEIQRYGGGSFVVSVVLDLEKKGDRWRLVRVTGYPFNQHRSGRRGVAFPPRED